VASLPERWEAKHADRTMIVAKLTGQLKEVKQMRREALIKHVNNAPFIEKDFPDLMASLDNTSRRWKHRSKRAHTRPRDLR
jgi:hypothetical protein